MYMGRFPLLLNPEGKMDRCCCTIFTNSANISLCKPKRTVGLRSPSGRRTPERETAPDRCWSSASGLGAPTELGLRTGLDGVDGGGRLGCGEPALSHCPLSLALPSRAHVASSRLSLEYLVMVRSHSIRYSHRPGLCPRERAPSVPWALAQHAPPATE